MSEREIIQGENQVLNSVRELGRLYARNGMDPPDNKFGGLEGQDVFIAGHRFHVVATIRKITFDAGGKAIAHLDNVHQISFDREDDIPTLYMLGDDHRFHEDSVGWTVQPVSGRSNGWQKAWFEAKERYVASKKNP